MNLLKNRTVIGVLCILLSLLICFGIAPLFSKSVSQKAEIVRVTREIRTGYLITADMVTVAEVGGYNLPESVIRQLDTVLGKYAVADLAAGDYILPAKCLATLPDIPCLICDFCPSDQRFAIRLPSDSTSRWTPLSLAMCFPLSVHTKVLHRLDYAHAVTDIIKMPLFDGEKSLCKPA